MTTMRAWRAGQLGDPWEVLEAADLPPPQPGADAVRIRVEATDMNFADILQCRGSYQVKRTPPFTPGMTAAGTVLATAPDGHWQTGQRIVGPTVDGAGGFAEQALLLASQCHPIPAGVESVAAMAMHVTYGTAWLALHHRARLQPGETVLVLAAAGGVGSAAVQMAHVHGCWVAAAAGGGDKTGIAMDMGADLAIDYEAEDLYERVMDATDGRGVDVIFDPVGGDTFATARRLLAWEGRLLVVGFASGDIPAAPANHVLVKNYAVVGVHMGGYRQRHPDLLSRCYEDLHQRLLAGEISPLVSEQITFEKIPDALRRLAARRTVGRVVFVPGSGG